MMSTLNVSITRVEFRALDEVKRDTDILSEVGESWAGTAGLLRLDSF
jgi:hypothetical protein